MGDILTDWIDQTAWMPNLHSREGNQQFCGKLIRDTVTFVAERADRCVGFLALDGNEIDALYVAKPERGQGTGTSLLDAAKQAVDHLTLWTFLANSGAQKFYVREGFSAIGRTDGARNDEKLPDVQFKWSRPT